MRFVVWIWKGTRNYLPQHVNYLYRQLTRVCPGRFSLVCITDELRGFDSGIEVVPTPSDALKLASLKTPERPSFPSCYRRLWMFSEGAKMLGDRVMLLDVDAVAVRDPSPLWLPTADFVGWRPLRTWGNEVRFGGGIYLLTTGSRTHVWTSFNGANSIAVARQAGLRGSDQAWLSYCLAKTEASWPKHSGIYSVRDLTHKATEMQSIRRRATPLGLPNDAIFVQFNGPDKPWDVHAHTRHAWLRSFCVTHGTVATR